MQYIVNITIIKYYVCVDTSVAKEKDYGWFMYIVQLGITKLDFVNLAFVRFAY